MKWSDSFVAYGEGQKAPIGGLADEALLNKLKTYKRQVAKRYRVIEPSKIDKYLPQGKLWISPKLDGELWFLVKRGDETVLCAYNGRILKDIPYLQSIADAVSDKAEFIIAGELVAPISAEGRPRSHHVATAFGDEKHASSLAFHPFDVVHVGEEDYLSKPYDERLAILTSWFGEEGLITTIEGEPADAVSHYQEWVSAGKHEGIVVRNEHNITYKIKPKVTIDLVVVAYGSRLVGEVRQLRELSVALKRDDGTLQLLGTVGNGFSEDDRIAWLAKLEAMETTSSFRMANSEGTLSRFVKPELVIECRCSDFLVTDSDDKQMRRMALSYDDAAENCYTPIGEMPTGVMLHPVFVKLRDDKSTDVADVGMDQITRHVQFEQSDDDNDVYEDVESSIIDRKVWTKTTKGKLAVRKYVLLETQRENQGYPKFVLFSTDFSPSRAEPLKTALKTADSRELADAQIEAWIKANIKKGWAEVEA